jgi:hypothetical protein
MISTPSQTGLKSKFQNIFQNSIYFHRGLQWSNRQSKPRLSPLRSWVRLSLRTHEKSQWTLYAESRGFSPGTQVSSRKESWQGGLGLAPNWPFHQVAAKGAVSQRRKDPWKVLNSIMFQLLCPSQFRIALSCKEGWLPHPHNTLDLPVSSTCFAIIWRLYCLYSELDLSTFLPNASNKCSWNRKPGLGLK